jgi:hypothetical protein
MSGAEKPAESFLRDMTYPALQETQTAAEQDIASARAWLARVNMEVERRLYDSAKAAFQQADKDSGTLKLPVQGGVIAKVDIKKTVKWDSAKLLELSKAMPWERVQQLFKIDFSVPENTYKAARELDPALADSLDTARTVVFSDPKITLTKEGEG